MRGNHRAERPFVSVMMPVHNQGDYVAEAVESVLAQTFRHFELLISDNASTDGTRSILEHLAATDRRIVLLRRDTPSLVQSLNVLLDLAQGDLIARMDGDDVALPNRFDAQVAFLREHPHVICLGTAYDMIDAKGRRFQTVRPSRENDAIQEEALSGITPLAHPTVMMRRRDVVEAGGYDERWDYAEDLDLWLRLGERGAVANLETVTLRYRVHERARTIENIERQAECVREMVEAAYRRRGIDRAYVRAQFLSRPEGRRGRFEQAAGRSYWALRHGERRTSLIYSARAIGLAPWRLFGWKMAARGLLGI